MSVPRETPGDVERITTTERPCHRVPELGGECAEYLRGRHDERVRVVEGLVATIKALPLVPVHWHPDDPTDLPSYFGDDWSKREGQMLIWLADVLAVVEAAREDTP